MAFVAETFWRPLKRNAVSPISDMKTNTDLFEELKKDIYDEFFFWLDKKGNSYLFAVSDFFYRARGGLLTGVAANLEGSKILISVDNAQELDNKIRKLSLAYDYVIVRHRTERPPVGWGMDVVPEDYFGNEFREPEYWYKYKDKVIKSKPLLHSQNAPHRDTIKDYFDWFVGPGREWLKEGNVVYVPNLPSEQVEQELFSEGVSLSNHYLDTNLLPANDAKYISAAELMCKLNLPSLSGCSADWLMKFREDNFDKINVFNQYLEDLIKHSKNYEVESNSYKNTIEDISKRISEDILKLNDNIKQQHLKFHINKKDLSYDLLPIAVSIFTDLSPWLATISSIPLARKMIKEMAENLKKNKEFKNSPLYIMTKLI